MPQRSVLEQSSFMVAMYEIFKGKRLREMEVLLYGWDPVV